MKTKQVLILALLALSALNSELSTAHAQGTTFSYQGQLSSSNSPANGHYDFTFTLYNNNATNIGRVSAPLTIDDVGVSNGLFIVTLNFGGVFTGTNYWLSIGVRTNGGTNFTALSPLQEVTPTPYAIFANTASNLSGTLSATDLSGTYSDAVTLNNAGNSFSGNGAGLTGVNAATLDGLSASQFWNLTGNAGTTPGVNFVGTTDNEPLQIHANGAQAFLLDGTTDSTQPNIIGGYTNNSVALSNTAATIAGGATNVILTGAYQSTIGGGAQNTISSNSYQSTIGGGTQNIIATNSSQSTISGGNENQLYGAGCNIGGGLYNQFYANAANPYIYASTIGGGYDNYVQIYGDNTSVEYCNIGGGEYNEFYDSSSGSNAYAYSCTIGGGQDNEFYFDGASAEIYSCNISGGEDNYYEAYGTDAYIEDCSIGGGDDNDFEVDNNAEVQECNISGGEYNEYYSYGTNALIYAATIGGGEDNDIETDGNSDQVQYCTISGGYDNFIEPYGTNASIDYSTIGGGYDNYMEGYDGSQVDYCTVGGGQYNEIYAENSVNVNYATIGGGYENEIFAQYSTIGGGNNNLIEASAPNSVIPGGYENVAGGSNSFAAGQNAQATNNGTFVWSDGSAATTSLTNNSVTLRATNGLRFFTGTTGAILFTNANGSGSDQFVSWTPGSGSWSFTSDRSVKDRFEAVDTETVLNKVAQLPISEWSYKGYGQRHIGAMAQDFHALFPFNDNDKALNDADLHGVELAAIKGLNQKLETEAKTKEAEIQDLKKELAEQKTVNQRMEEQFGELEKTVARLANHSRITLAVNYDIKEGQ